MDNELDMERIVRGFLPGAIRCTVSTGASGMNNTTRFVEVDGNRYVLRIYETHRDDAKVRYEHAVLLALAELGTPFGTPLPIRTPAGDTFVRVDAEDGPIAALFRYMDGESPELAAEEQLKSFGRAAGQLSDALSQVSVHLEPAYRPYYEIEHIHPRSTPAEVACFCESPPEEFAGEARALAVIGERLKAFASDVPSLRKLPHGLVHGDLNASNMLAASDGTIAAILDFEFVTHDLRVMEPAVCISDLIRSEQEEDAVWRGVGAFLAGYGDTASLLPEEIAAVPLLVELRALDIFVHFLGRYWDGVDPAAVVQEQIREAAAMCGWLLSRTDRLIGVCERYASSGRSQLPARGVTVKDGGQIIFG